MKSGKNLKKIVSVVFIPFTEVNLIMQSVAFFLFILLLMLKQGVLDQRQISH